MEQWLYSCSMLPLAPLSLSIYIYVLYDILYIIYTYIHVYIYIYTYTHTHIYFLLNKMRKLRNHLELRMEFSKHNNMVGKGLISPKDGDFPAKSPKFWT